MSYHSTIPSGYEERRHASPLSLSPERLTDIQRMKADYQSNDDLEGEGMSLLKPEVPLTIDDEIAERRLGMFFWILIIVGFSGFVAFFGWDREIVQIITRYFGSKASTTTTDLYIQASNEYGTFTAPYPWLEDVIGSQLVEPYKQTTLTITGAYSTGCTYDWNLNYPSSESPMLWSESTPLSSITLTQTGTYSLTLEAYDSKTGSFKGRYSTLLVVKYVRREIRQLSEGDRIRFLKAAVVLWNTSTDDGRYGG